MGSGMLHGGAMPSGPFQTAEGFVYMPHSMHNAAAWPNMAPGGQQVSQINTVRVESSRLLLHMHPCRDWVTHTIHMNTVAATAIMRGNMV